MKSLVYWLAVLLLLPLIACKTKSLPDADNAFIPEEGQDYILTLIFKFTENDEGKLIVDLEDKIYAQGRLKNEKHTLKASDAIQLCFKDRSGNELKRISFEDPIHKWMEHSTEEGKIERTKVTLDEGIQSVRVNYDDNWETIHLYEVDETELKALISFSI